MDILVNLKELIYWILINLNKNHFSKCIRWIAIFTIITLLLALSRRLTSHNNLNITIRTLLSSTQPPHQPCASAYRVHTLNFPAHLSLYRKPNITSLLWPSSYTKLFSGHVPIIVHKMCTLVKTMAVQKLKDMSIGRNFTLVCPMYRADMFFNDVYHCN